MDVVEIDAFKPAVKLDVLRIIGVDVADTMFVGAARTVQVIPLVLLATETIGLFLDNCPDEIFAFVGNSGLGRKVERGLVVLLIISMLKGREESALPTRMFILVCCLPPSSAKKGVWP